MKSRRAAGQRSREWSHPARGAWIEILSEETGRALAGVAPRKGCVD